MKYVLLILFLGYGVLSHGQILRRNSSQYSFRYRLDGWNVPPFWNGKVRLENNCMVLESSVGRGKEFARIYASQHQIDFFPGYHLRFTIEAKGEGHLEAGYLVYPQSGGAPDYLRGRIQELSSEFKIFRYDVEITGVPRRVFPYIEIKGRGKAVIRSLVSENLVTKGVSIQSETPLQIIRENEIPRSVRYRTSLKNSPFLFIQIQGNIQKRRIIESDGSGELTVQPEAGKEGDIQFSVSTGGVSASTFADVMKNDEFDKFDAAARKIKAGKTFRSLIIGDSLSDYYRGRNYVNKLTFWLNKYNPGKFSFRNAGVAGDLLPRVKQRILAMNGGKKAYRQEMYDGLFGEKYDLVMVFLGQNDTYVTRSGNFNNPRTPVDQQESLMKWLVNCLQEKTGAPVVLISPSPSNYALYKQQMKKNKGNFGVHGTPKFINGFDTMNRKVCREMKLGYIDILNPMRQNPDIKSLYVDDGVHLTCKGARLIAYELLKWFAAYPGLNPDGIRSTRKEKNQ